MWKAIIVLMLVYTSGPPAEKDRTEVGPFNTKNRCELTAQATSAIRAGNLPMGKGILFNVKSRRIIFKCKRIDPSERSLWDAR